MEHVENVMMHTVKFANGNSVTVSELINNEAVQVLLKHNAGMVTVTTEFVCSEQGARELGKLLVKHHNKQEEHKKELSLADMNNELSALRINYNKLVIENGHLQAQIKTTKPKRKTA